MDVKDLCMGCMEESAGSGKCPHCGWLHGQEAESPLYLPPGTVLQDQFIVGRVLGHGGFGITYLAWDLNLERRVALKEYMPNGIATRTTGTFTVNSYSGQKAGYELGLQKFIEEARVLARFQSHPGMVAVQYFFQANGTAYLMMEYLEGVTLDAYLKDNGGTIPFKQAMDVLMPVMDALREVHKTGILHRDVSPDNIYITRAGPVKLLDFGAARFALGQHSQNFSIILKEGYAPEEQYRSKGHQGPWTDVYACAATIYRAVTGKVPIPALDRAHVDELEAPSALGVKIATGQEEALMKALAVDAATRYQSMEDFQAAIGGLKRGRDSVEFSNVTVPLREAPEASTGERRSQALPFPRKEVEKQNAFAPLLAFTRKIPGGPRVATLAIAAVIALILVVLAITHHPRGSASTAQQITPSAPPANANPANPKPTPPAAPSSLQTTSRGTPKNQAPAPERIGPAAPLKPRSQPIRNQPRQPSQSSQSSQSVRSASPAQPAPPANGQPSAPPPSGQSAGQGYQAIIAQAEAAMRQHNSAQVVQLAQQAIQMDPKRPTAYDILGFTELYDQNNYEAARQNYLKAIQHGGSALFRVRHDQNDGTFMNTSSGNLRVGSFGVRYASSSGSDSFSVARDRIEQADMNKSVATNFKRFFGRVERGQQSGAPLVHGAFHIRGDAQNYNLLGTSSDPTEEARIILGLINR